MVNQAYLFIVFIINGVLIGILFDLFRILRKSFKTSDFITYIEDITFWVLAGFLTLYFIFNFNNGEIRFYILLGIVLGIITYIITFSKYIIKFSVKIVSFIKCIISKINQIIIYPLKFIINILKKVLFRPISFICINIRKIFTNSKFSISNFIKKRNKTTKNVT